MRKTLREPSASTRGSRKHESPPPAPASSACASTRKASDIGAEQNHLCPVSRYGCPGPPRPAGRATVVLARTSEPPCFSVIDMPKIADVLSADSPGEYSRFSARGTHCAATSGCSSSDGITACVIDTGQACPGSICAYSMKAAARTTCEPGRGSDQQRVWAPCRTAEEMMR
jgi:hypothetical protein